ncbi:unnamed protein product [Macrosiphum euphorbiae]|uniref:Uncharacterized protein n=1 Tax=Macrosiphum euphorbiae TaxID=13131 RepID=A0AAV0W1E7_9HEMI|nr:unnamed protein product [Macrosiphum euphorbiae]
MVDSQVTDTSCLDRNQTMFAMQAENSHGQTHNLPLSKRHRVKVKVPENLQKALGPDPDRQTAPNDF